MTYSNLFVCLMGIITVFIWLVCIVFLTNLLSYMCREKERPPKKTPPTPAEKLAENRQELIAVLSAAIAEDMGRDVSAIRILSVKKIA